MDRPWRRPHGREARNEQRKLRGSLFNAMAMALLIAAVAGPFVNPALETTLDLPERVLMGASGWLLHLLARRMVRDIEDK